MTKQKHASIEQENLSDWSETLQEYPAFSWLINNRKSIPYIFLTILALIIIGYKITSNWASKTETSYLQADHAFQILQHSIQDQSGGAERSTALNDLKSITTSYPELQSKYDGLIAQLLLAEGRLNEAIPFAERSLKRTSHDDLKTYQEFTNITLAIGESKWQEALERSQSLKETLKDENQSLLYAFNLFRLGMLSQQLNMKDLEHNTWTEWNTLAKGNAYKTINDLFTEGTFSLNSYIKDRFKTLEKS